MLAPMASAKALHSLHELRVFDLVERAGPAGELHARLQLAVAAPGAGASQAPVSLSSPSTMTSLLPTWRFDGRWARTTSPATGASSVIGAQASMSASSCSGRRFETRRAGAAASSRCAVVVRERRPVAVARRRGARLFAHAGDGALRPGAARLPRAVRDDAGEDDAAERGQGDGEAVQGAAGVGQAASASRIAPGMSTVTMRETPCSCIVTPISCSAISIAMRLWLMNRIASPSPSR